MSFTGGLLVGMGEAAARQQADERRRQLDLGQTQYDFISQLAQSLIQSPDERESEVGQNIIGALVKGFKAGDPKSASRVMDQVFPMLHSLRTSTGQAPPSAALNQPTPALNQERRLIPNAPSTVAPELAPGSFTREEAVAQNTFQPPAPPPEQAAPAQAATPTQPRGPRTPEEIENEVYRLAPVRYLFGQDRNATKRDIIRKQLYAMEDIRVKSQLQTIPQMMRSGQKPVFDYEGNVAGFQPMGVEDLPADKKAQIKEREAHSQRLQAQSEVDKARLGLMSSQQELADARAALARAGNDPSQPAFKLAQQRAIMAQQTLNLRSQNLDRLERQYQMQAYGTGAKGEILPGAVLDIAGSPIGTGYARWNVPTTQTRSQAEAAGMAIPAVQDLKDFVDLNPHLFGLAGGTLTDLRRSFGSNDPAVGALDAKIKSTAILLGRLHTRAAYKFFLYLYLFINKRLGPEGFKGALDALANTGKLVQEKGTPRTYVPSGAPPAQPQKGLPSNINDLKKSLERDYIKP